QIVDETQQTSKAFFEKLEEGSSLSVTEFLNEVNTYRSAMDSYTTRVDSLSTPGDMGDAQGNLELVYELRSSAMTEIAEQMSTALGARGAQQAVAKITRQMQKLLASDVVYGTVVKPEIDGVLADNGIEGSDVPASNFLPEGTKWLDESTVAAALGSVSGSAESETGTIHGLGLAATSIGETELAEGSPVSVSSEGTPEVEVQVENQGDSTENNVTVSVTAGGNTIDGSISSIGAGEVQSVAIPLTPAPSGETTLEVEVHTVPGERISSNNKASYTVTFE
ncbi:MAG TPA: CARDB domain-containing protein, partial [Solirubrobacterales bacterium]|nr:CARDB domain-containing protein [Solirubrobacterales bacterium]